jgi:hypothetical protein
VADSVRAQRGRSVRARVRRPARRRRRAPQRRARRARPQREHSRARRTRAHRSALDRPRCEREGGQLGRCPTSGRRTRMAGAGGASESARLAADALLSARGRVIVARSEVPFPSRTRLLFAAGASAVTGPCARRTGMERAGGTGVAGARAEPRSSSGMSSGTLSICGRSRTRGARSRWGSPRSRSRHRSRWRASRTPSRPRSRLRRSAERGAADCLTWRDRAVGGRRMRAGCASPR